MKKAKVLSSIVLVIGALVLAIPGLHRLGCGSHAGDRIVNASSINDSSAPSANLPPAGSVDASLHDGSLKSKPSDAPAIGVELKKISGAAFAMAKMVADDASKRTEYAQQAKGLLDQVNKLADQLESMDANEYQKRSNIISESVLDLNYVIAATDVTSHRMSQILEIKKKANP